MNLKKRNEILFTFQFNTEYLNPIYIYIYLNCIKKLKIIFLPKQQKKKEEKRSIHLIKNTTRDFRSPFPSKSPHRMGARSTIILANWLSSKTLLFPPLPSIFDIFPRYPSSGRLQLSSVCSKAAKVRSNLRLGVIR